MSAITNKRAVMTLFSGPTDIFSHQVRIVLAHKGINIKIEPVEKRNSTKDCILLHPPFSIPTLIDRELTLYQPQIIMEYLDERFPHPPLLPVYPIERAESRLIMHRIQHDWYVLMHTAQNNMGSQAESARKKLQEELQSVNTVFARSPFFMSEEFSLIDCYLAPLFWRLPQIGIHISKPNSKDLKDYMNRVFTHSSFLSSLSEEENAMQIHTIK
ncbi:Stringent starvation protein A [Candidatus Erwinia haradaeae]|uniref:Stringent starvation protein A n=1 Tax=Candidatus Erwinia haradaeae TaxID=1922217 RepID=A0A451CYM2_9GAMM|nr:glutathione binding-like protein [Candidatus Erwinia haradaeae]VFP78523.1 Stringent starvation protein A [Candidatus Erwinia haradaeae]